jgi:hypothetical protein
LEVTKNCIRDSATLGPQDFVVILRGSNDEARNETDKCLNTLKSRLGNLTHTNVMLNIPQRYDLMKGFTINVEVQKADKAMGRFVGDLEM